MSMCFALLHLVKEIYMMFFTKPTKSLGISFEQKGMYAKYTTRTKPKHRIVSVSK